MIFFLSLRDHFSLTLEGQDMEGLPVLQLNLPPWMYQVFIFPIAFGIRNGDKSKS